MKSLEDLIKEIIEFRNERNWKQFHNPKDVALSLSLEASEVVEHFQWKNSEEINEYIKTNKSDIADELADVLYWVLLMSYDLDINILDALNKKMQKNVEKYPVEKSKNRHNKYDNL